MYLYEVWLSRRITNLGFWRHRTCRLPGWGKLQWQLTVKHLRTASAVGRRGECPGAGGVVLNVVVAGVGRGLASGQCRITEESSDLTPRSKLSDLFRFSTVSSAFRTLRQLSSLQAFLSFSMPEQHCYGHQHPHSHRLIPLSTQGQQQGHQSHPTQ